ncbi:hypothetical protein CapIbe_019132 [Capra ibex]
MGRLPTCTPVDLSSLGARQLIPNASFHSTKKSVPCSGLVSHQQQAKTLSEPSRPLEDPGEPATASSSQPHVWHRNLLRKDCCCCC